MREIVTIIILALFAGLLVLSAILIFEAVSYVLWLVRTGGTGDYWSSHLHREEVKKL